MQILVPLAEHSFDAYKALIPLRGDDDAFTQAIYDSAEIVHDLTGNFDFPMAYLFKDGSALTVDLDHEITIHETFEVEKVCVCDTCKLTRMD